MSTPRACRTANRVEPHRELDWIAKMLKAAASAGLEAEAIWSFGQGRAKGMSVIEAINFALSEWDL